MLFFRIYKDQLKDEFNGSELKFLAINYFCNILYSNLNLKKVNKDDEKHLNEIETENICYLLDNKITSKNSKFHHIKSIILSFFKRDKDKCNFLLLLNEHYLYYQELYNALEKEKNKYGGFSINLYFNNYYKYMIVSIAKDSSVNTVKASRDSELSNLSDVIIIVSEDIYKFVKKQLNEMEVEIEQLICITFQDEAIDLYYNYQKYIDEKYLDHLEDKYFIQSNYGKKLSYKFIKEKYINEMNLNENKMSCLRFSYEKDYQNYRKTKMSSKLITFIDNIICKPFITVNDMTTDIKRYAYSLELNNSIFENNNIIVGPLCETKEEARIEVFLLLFKILYHLGSIKLPVLEGSGLNNGTSNSSFYCPYVFSNDLWETLSSSSYPSSTIYEPQNLFFITYLELNYDNNSENPSQFMYKDGNDSPNIELCLGYVTKRPIPTNVPIVDIKEYKFETYQFNVKSWNKFGQLNQIQDNLSDGNLILDNIECQSYLPVYFSDAEEEKIKMFQEHTWKILYGNNNLQPDNTEDRYYIIPMSKIENSVDINWEIIDNVNSIMSNLQEKNNITLGDWIFYANYFIEKPYEKTKFDENSFEENCYYMKQFHKEMMKNTTELERLKEEYCIKNMKEETQKCIKKSLKKTYLMNKFDKTICFFTNFSKGTRMTNTFTLNRKAEESKEMTYKEFFEEKYDKLKDEKYRYEDIPLFAYDAHSLIHSLQREDDDEEDDDEKKNMHIPELYYVITVPHVWIKLLSLVPILTYKIKIFCLMDELRYQIGLKQLTVSSIYRASISKSADPIIGEQHERLELLGDTILKYLTTLNILNSFFNRNEDLLIRRRNEFIKNDFLIEQVNNLGWKKYSIKQRYTVKNFCPPGLDIRQSNGDTIARERIIKDDKDDKPIADFFEALIGACFEDGIYSYKNKNDNRITIDKIYSSSNKLNIKNKAKALEEGIKLCKLFLIRCKFIITDHWKWTPSLTNEIVRKTHNKSIRTISKILHHHFEPDSALFSIIGYSKEMYSKYTVSE